MNYQIVTRRMLYYVTWFDSLTKEEKSTPLGKWIRERITLFNEAITHDIRNRNS